ncbi:MAG: hypothetical protein IPP14_16090 [Planctomycetes bacterium]|nr:hypothetical protein [Planctomycetota bacterium]
MATEGTSQSQAELAERKQELEEELEAYTQKGIVSPSLLKFARWFSRGLWFALSALLVITIYDSWGKIPRTDYDAAVKSARDWADRAKKAESALAEAAGGMVLIEAEADRRGIDTRGKGSLVVANEVIGAGRTDQERADAARNGPEGADAAARRARNLVQRAWGEIAYAQHWRQALQRAEPGAHGNDPRGAALDLISQAATAPAAQRFELLRELADFGAEAVGGAARGLLAGTDNGPKVVAAMVVARLGQAADVSLLDKVAAELPAGNAQREVYFAASVLDRDSGQQSEVPATTGAGTELAEYQLRFALRGFNARQSLLQEAYKSADEAQRLDLMALLAETGGVMEEEMMKTVASSNRPGAERILAVRWLKANQLAPDLLKTLSQGQGPVAQEAK